jgi:hypothetical protein
MRAMKARSNARLLSIRHAEAETGLPAALLRDLIHRGVLKGIQPPGIRRMFIDRRDLETAIESWKGAVR